MAEIITDNNELDDNEEDVDLEEENED